MKIWSKYEYHSLRWNSVFVVPNNMFLLEWWYVLCQQEVALNLANQWANNVERNNQHLFIFPVILKNNFFDLYFWFTTFSLYFPLHNSINIEKSRNEKLLLSIYKYIL